MSPKSFFQTILAACLLFTAAAAPAENWPQWRGPQGNSVSTEKNLPISWTPQQGLQWKVDLPEWGTSGPCIWGDAVFVTSHQNEDLLLLKINRKAGKIEWTKTVGKGDVKRIPLAAKTAEQRREQNFHVLHNLASPTPCTDGKTVVVHFGNGDLAAYDYEGNQIWKRNLVEDYGQYTIWWGHANSPIIFGDTVINACMQDSLEGVAEPLSPSYVVAHDLATGKLRWKTARMTGAKSEECDAYTTPLIYKHNDRLEMAIMGGNHLDAYDPKTGRQLWHLPNVVGGRTVTGPTVAHGLIFATQGKSGPLLAVKLGGKGELSRQQIAWKSETGTPDTCCPVVWDRWLFTLTDGGVLRCFDAVSGQEKWKERVKGDYKASPVVADGRIYCLSTKGLCTVVAAAARFERLAESQLDDETLAAPAISDEKILIRGRKSLYSISKP